MATVVLTAVGSIFGPIGSAIGALAGQAIDGALFKPAGRQGPRIADLRVQTSSFGAQVPQMFGRMRVAGTVIWATDLMESPETTGGGKGRPNVTAYNYAASFAVALSSRPIIGVGRIWADGNLLRGEAGDFKSGISAFRVHGGGADQSVDPMIAADRGMDRTPAHRGIAYAVFEGLQLADFGNRIPSLTFELIADEGEVSVTSIVATLAGEAAISCVGNDEAPTVGGYAAVGENAGEGVQPLLDGYALMVRPAEDGMALTKAVVVEAVLCAGDDLVRARGEALAGRTVERDPVETVPRRLTVRHYDPARDYQAGTQSAERQGAGWEEAQVDLPATLEAAGARQRATDLLRRRILGRRSITLARGWDALPLAPGDVVGVAGQDGERLGGGWRVDTTEWEGMAVKIRLTAVPTRTIAPPDMADSGSGILQPDRIVGPTHVMIVETPQLYESLVDAPQLFVAACGNGAGWRGAAILLRDETGGYVPSGSVRRAAVLGVALTALTRGTSRMFDTVSTVEVQLHDGDAVLTPASDAALLNGANACMIGEELLQYGTVSASGPGRYRLGRLLRGRRGTEHHMAGHAIGDSFVLLDSDRLLPIGEGRALAGRLHSVAAQGLGDATPAEAYRIADGRAVLPLSPAHVRMAGNVADGLTLGWTRRSRLGWAWSDGVDAPLGEEQEAYRIEVCAGATLIRSDMLSAPAWSYPSDVLEGDLALAGALPITLMVRQCGTYGAGPGTSIPLPFDDRSLP